ncbi:hypothetical protein [Acetobacterium wieringae]|uniref:hypothetical protein n=1 Tax=Acetobacterium wieringae TaxID=52694 RepID=UPI002034336F|nr:hypothetical protein [Acetobacterium wieringae]URN84966.1 hypothetical protein CHL1_000567 [Acetobacterium wieringae]
MEWIQVVINVVLTILLGLFIKNYLPSYMDEKGKNLATKEDIQEITRKTEEVQKEFKEGFEYFSSDLRFKYDFYHKQYSELYSKIYAIVIQSEYVRRFIQITKGQEHSFEEIPFFEVTPTQRVNQQLKLEVGKPVAFSQSSEEIETPISQFNKRQLCDYIIENGEYATQELLKIAVSYRFAYSHYEGNPEVKNSSCADAANDEEFRLIRDMVCCIVKEYNYFRKELKMNYNHSELESGIPQL